MKRILSIAAVAALFCIVSSCTFSFPLKVIRGNGVSVTNDIDVPEFSSISILGSADVFYTQGPQSVSLTADENLVEYYIVEVEEGKLVVRTEKGVSLSPKTKTFITVSSPDLSEVTINGSGDCSVKDGLKTEGGFDFIVAGSGDLYADSIECKEFTSKVSGSGDVKVDAIRCEASSTTIQGSGDSAVGNLCNGDIEIRISGSGDVAIGCENAGDINVRITGSGDVKLWGSARTLGYKVSGSGSVDSKRLALSGAE